MNAWNIERLADLLAECGKIALKYYDNPPMEFKSDHSVVTAADKAIEKMLAAEFDKPEENTYMIGEETVETKDENYIQNALKGTTWIVDPIDGTAPYSNHIPTWGVSIALMRNGKIIEGAIYLPVFNEIFISQENHVLYSNDFPNSKELRALCPKLKSFNEAGMVSISQKVTKLGKFRLYNPVQAIGSCVYSLAGLANGQYMAYIATVKLWDIAGGLPILKKCGFQARLANGKDLGLDVSEEFYNLAPNGQQRWQLKTHAAMAPDTNIIERIFSASELPE